ncbi:MAG: thiamine phosphate synthase [Oscillospiraceae bacterium]|nr:thiamine phosphate synthase [Oscillospiraceae bacterium]
MTAAKARGRVDVSAYLVVGPENTEGRSVREIVAAAVAAGFTCVQIRSKEASARELIALTREAAQVITAAARRVTLLVDDRLDVVLAARQLGVKVDGVHVGQSDIPPEVCRACLGEEAVVGLSARTDALLDYVQGADVGPVDYFGAGPLHETATKPDCGRNAEGRVVTRSFAELRELARVSPIPVVVGGGVKLADIAPLKATGVDGFFVVSAVAGAPDPREAAAALVDAWREAKP